MVLHFVRFCATTSLLFLGGSYFAVKAAAFATTGPAFSASSKRNGRPGMSGSNGDRRLSQGLQMSVPNSLDVLTSGLASIFCLPRGVAVSSPGSQSSSNTRITKLYDVENSKSCRAVREKITELDLVVEQIIPVATGSQNAATMPGGKAPVLVATTTSSDGEEEAASSRTIEGTDAILFFLDESFPLETGSIPQESEDNGNAIVKEKLQLAGMYLASWMRLGRGNSVSPSVGNRPEKPLVLYSYEGNQFCRLVREVLTELDIVYELRSAGTESPRRSELASITGGSSQCPYLIDPNTGASMPESADIVEYLYRNYASWTPPSELLEWVSTNVMSLAKPVFRVLAPLQAGENDAESDFKAMIRETIQEIETEAAAAPIVVYTYELSPFSIETTSLLDRLDVEYKEISLGKEWLPGLIAENGAIKRAALLEMTGQSSLPHIFVDGNPIGGLFSGSPGLCNMLESGEFFKGRLDSASVGNLNQTDAFQ
jgi:anaphase-promoting complex subunit 7